MKQKSKLTKTLILLLIILIPSQLGKHFWPTQAYVAGLRLDYLSPTLFLSDLVIFALFLVELSGNLFKFDKLKMWLKKHTLIILFFFLFIFLNILFSSSKTIVFYNWLNFLKLLFLFNLVRKLPVKTIAKLVQFLTIPNLFSSSLAILQFFKQSSLGGVCYWFGERSFSLTTPGIAKSSFFGHLILRPYATFSHPNSLAGFLLVSLIIFVFYRKKLGNNLFYPVFFLNLLALVFTLSQGALLVFLLLFPLSLFLSLNRNRFLKSLLIAFPVILLLFLFPPETESFQQRDINISKSVIVAQENPLFGVGLGNFIPASYQLVPPESYTSATLYFQPPHNIFLLTLTETGLIGLIYLTVFFIKSLRRAFKLPSPVFMIALLCILLTGLVDHYWLTLVQNKLLLTIILGLTWNEKTES